MQDSLYEKQLEDGGSILLIAQFFLVFFGEKRGGGCWAICFGGLGMKSWLIDKLIELHFNLVKEMLRSQVI
jgi:hypothetical protein